MEWKLLERVPDLEDYEEIDTWDVTREEIRDLGRELVGFTREAKIATILFLNLYGILPDDAPCGPDSLSGALERFAAKPVGVLTAECGRYLALFRYDYETDTFEVSVYERSGW